MISLKTEQKNVSVKGDIIKDFSVACLGEAKGHNFYSDKKFLEQIADYGNSIKNGVKSRFGHPNMCDDALGTFMGRAKNFRLREDRVVADLHFDSSAKKTPKHGDLVSYIKKLASSDSNSFGASIVFKKADDHYEEVSPDDERNKVTRYSKDEDGNEVEKYYVKFARLKQLVAIDLVDSPALGDSFFSESVLLSDKATKFLDEFLQNEDAVKRAYIFLNKYINYKEVPMGDYVDKDKMEEEEKDKMEKEKIEKEKMEKEKKEKMEKEEKEKMEKEEKEMSSLAALERDRCLSILDSAMNVEDISLSEIKELMAGSLDSKDCEIRMYKKALSRRQSEPVKAGKKGITSIEEELSKWDRSEQLQNDFRSKEAYRIYLEKTQFKGVI